jgi:hypothetical protein
MRWRSKTYAYSSPCGVSSLRESLRNISNDKVRDFWGRLQASFKIWLPAARCIAWSIQEPLLIKFEWKLPFVREIKKTKSGFIAPSQCSTELDEADLQKDLEP